MPLTLMHGPDRMLVDAAGRGLHGSDYVSFFGIAPMAVRFYAKKYPATDEGAEPDPLGWTQSAHLIGASEEATTQHGTEMSRALAELVEAHCVLSFAESAEVAQAFLAVDGAHCSGGSDAAELWAVKEGPTASVWRAAGGAHQVAINVARDCLAARDLAESADRLTAAAHALGTGSVAEPLASAWMGGQFVLAQRWVDDSHELGIYRDRNTGVALLTKVERFLTGGAHPASLDGVQGWPVRGDAAAALIAEIADLAVSAAASGIEANQGATGLSIGQGDLVMAGGRCAIVACNGPPIAAVMPDAEALAATLFNDLWVDDVLVAALVAALEDRLARRRARGHSGDGAPTPTNPAASGAQG